MLGFLTSVLEKLDRKQHPFLREVALDSFVEHHHRAPTKEELNRLENECARKIKSYLVDKHDLFLKASDLLIEKLPGLIPGDEWEDFKNEFEKAYEKLNTPDLKLDGVDQSGKKVSLHTTLGLSMRTLRTCYEAGKELFREGRSKDAAAIFDFISYLNPYVADFWQALGLCYFERGDYEEALEPFAKVSLLDAKPFLARAKAIECYLALKEPDQAKLELEQFEKLIKIRSTGESWNSVAEGLSYKIDVMKQYG